MPEAFDGNRAKTEKFMNAFDLFWMSNEENSHMKNPYKRCTYFLGLFEGPKVEDWVVDQTDILRNKTTRTSDPVAKNDNDLWEDLKDAFKGAFAHTGKVEQARFDLLALEMDGDQIDEYIAKFENLLKKAEIPRNEVGAIEKFKNGLRKGVLAKLLSRDTWPETIDQWEESSRREVRRMGIIRESLGPLTPRQTKWRTFSQQFKTGKQKKDQAIPMEIDAAKVPEDPKKAKEVTRLRNEGRCFKCQKQGHMKNACPDWGPKDKGKPPPYQPKARMAAALPTIEEEGPSKQTQEVGQLARTIRGLNDQTTDELFHAILEKEDF